MQKLSNTRLSKTKLSTGQDSKIQELDSPIPLSIQDLIPQGAQTHRLESTKNQEYWTGLLEKKK